MDYALRDFEAHVTGFSKYAASSVAMGLSDYCVGGFVHELRRVTDGVELFEVGDGELCQPTTTFELVPLDFHLYSVSSMDTDPLLMKIVEHQNLTASTPDKGHTKWCSQAPSP